MYQSRELCAQHVAEALVGLKNARRAAHSAGFFKTGQGEYAYGDVFWGISVPECRKVAGHYRSLPIAQAAVLLKSRVHEHRLVALIILIDTYCKGTVAVQEKITRVYLKYKKYINNWDLVDVSAPKILGDYLREKDRTILYTLASSENLWDRRIAIVSTLAFIRNNDLSDTFNLAERLLFDTHDLIHKAVGWMLREAGKKDRLALTRFLSKHYRKMPRTMLRYAIEKFDESARQYYLKGKD